MSEQAVKKLQVVAGLGGDYTGEVAVEQVVFVDEAGVPVPPGGGESEPVTWGTLPGKPAVIAAGADADAARTSIGAGTSSVVVGSTAGAALAAAGAAGSSAQAARADHVHPLPATLTAAAAQTGTATTPALITAKVLADEIDRRVAAAIAAIPPAG